MTAGAAMAARRVRLELVIFDCDGVLVDSEAVASRVVAAELTALGWPMDQMMAQRLFVGMTLTDMEPVIAARLGRPISPNWRSGLTRSIVAAMEQEAVLVDGAVEALAGVDRLGVPWRVASNSSHEELTAKFARTGLSGRVAGRVHSYRDVARGKPAPDLFLAAAAAEGAAPAACLVIEDSLAGVTAAVAAGMDCLAYCPHGAGDDLQAAGAHPICSLRDIPALIAIALQVPA